MAQRGRPKKKEVNAIIASPAIDHAKLLKQFEQEQQVQLENFYKDLAKIKHKVDLALTQVGFIDDCENLSQAAFKAGRAFGPLDEANDRLEDMLEEIFSGNDFDHWDDVLEN